MQRRRAGSNANVTDASVTDASVTDASVRVGETSVFRRLLPYLRPHGRVLVFGLLLLLVSIPANNFHPIAWAYIVDEVIGHRRVDRLPWAIAAMFGVQAL